MSLLVIVTKGSCNLAFMAAKNVLLLAGKPLPSQQCLSRRQSYQAVIQLDYLYYKMKGKLDIFNK